MAGFDRDPAMPMKTLCSRVLVLAALVLPSAAQAQRQDPTYTEDRFNQLQQTITMLTGQIEQLQYSNQQLQQQMEKLRADYDFRIEQLEKGRGGGPAGPRPTQPMSGSAAPPPKPSGAPATATPPPASGSLAAGSGDQLYHEAFKLLQDGDYAGAEKAFRTFVQQNPQHVLAGNAQYWLGETYYARRNYQDAATAFAEGYKVYKASPKGPDNLLKLGITLAALGRKSDACAVFARFNQDYPRATDLQKRRVDQERQHNACG
jgi:tol-pal system protein YbgF